MKRCAWLLAAGVVLYAAGCNCGKPLPASVDAGPDAGPPVTAQTVCSDLAVKACDFFIRCHSEQTLGFDFGEGRAVTNVLSNDQVAASERARCEALISQSQNCVVFSSSVDAGRMLFDSNGYGVCIGALYPADTCARDVNAVLASECNALPFLVANTQAGSLCDLDRECQAGFCTAADVNHCGVCQSSFDAGTGAPCTRDSECDARFEYCPGADGTAGSCTAYSGEAAACNPLDPDQEQCGPGNVCTLTQTFPAPQGQCAPAKHLGDSCTVNKFECARLPHGGLVPQQVCAPALDLDGGSRYQCVPLQAVAGGACGNGDSIPFVASFPMCLETEWCNANQCAPRKIVDQTCGTNAECIAGTQCSQSNSARTCQAFLDVGGACGDSSQCKNLLGCPSGGGTCGPEYSLTTEPCGTNQQNRACVEGFCPDPNGSNCAAYLPTGASCGGNSQCRSDQCSITCESACWGS